VGKEKIPKNKLKHKLGPKMIQLNIHSEEKKYYSLKNIHSKTKLIIHSTKIFIPKMPYRTGLPSLLP